MTRETHTNTSQSGSSRDFAHVNNFSILAPDDNEFTGRNVSRVTVASVTKNRLAVSSLVKLGPEVMFRKEGLLQAREEWTCAEGCR